MTCIPRQAVGAPAGTEIGSCPGCVLLVVATHRTFAPPRSRPLSLSLPNRLTTLAATSAAPPLPLPRSTGILQLCFGRNCGLLLGTAGGRRARNKLDLRLLHNLNREATQQVGNARRRRHVGSALSIGVHAATEPEHRHPAGCLRARSCPGPALRLLHRCR